MEKIYFTQPYFQLIYNPEYSLVKAVYSGFLSSSEIHTACLKCLELLTKENPKIWLTDNRKMKAIRQADQEWIITHLWSRLGISSLQKMATLTSDDIFNQMAVASIFAKASNHIKFEHQFFKSECSAVTWLKQNSRINSARILA